MPGFVSISTLIVSVADMIFTAVLASCTGHLRCKCPCFEFEHDEEKRDITTDEAEKIAEKVERRMSAHQ